MTDKILLGGIEFFAYGGVSEAERRVGQRYVADVELAYDLHQASASDDLADTVNYSQVYELIVQVGTQSDFHLLERLAQQIATAVLDAFPVEAITVRLKKRPPPIDGVLEYAGVEIPRRRDS